MKLDERNPGYDWPTHWPPFRMLNDEEAAEFDRDGAVLLDGVLDPAVVRECAAELDRLEAENETQLRDAGGRQGIQRADEITFTICVASKSDLARQFVRQQLLVDLAVDVLGPDVNLYWDQAVYKKPAVEQPFPWHQDNGYAFVEPQLYLTCWIPLTRATVENGCTWIWPGAHRQGTLAHWDTPLGRVCKEGDEGAVPMEAEVGDIVVFSSLTPHRSGPNRTNEVRKAYVVQYAPVGARVVGGDPIGSAAHQFPIARQGGPVPSVSA